MTMSAGDRDAEIDRLILGQTKRTSEDEGKDNGEKAASSLALRKPLEFVVVVTIWSLQNSETLPAPESGCS